MNSTDKIIQDRLKQEQAKRRNDLNVASMQNLTNDGLSGALYFSGKQFRKLQNEGRDRCFGQLQNGKVVEYTEMISFEMLKENPADTSGYDDAICLGYGKFHHWRYASGNEW